MATKLNLVKSAIQRTLESLVRQDILREIQIDDFKKSIFNRDFAKYPVAIMTTPTVESVADTNLSNMRTYNFEIVVLSKQEDVADAAQIEELIENCLNEFDNDPTLKAGEDTGIADGGVEPSTSSPEAVQSGGRTWIAFSILLRVRATRDLTFQ